MANLERSAGSLAEGQPANLVALDESGRLLGAIVNGKLAMHA
jgi:N-acetylglucosamine-6-phosphate deacetylase